MKRIQILSKKLPGNTLIRVLIVFIIIAILFTIKEVAELVSKGIAAATGNKVIPPVEMVQNTSANMAWAGVGLFLLLIAPVFIVGVVKWGLILAGAAIVGVAVYNLYNTFFNKKSESVLPNRLTK